MVVEGSAGLHQESSGGKTSVKEATYRKRKPLDGAKEETSAESSAKVKPQDTGAKLETNKAVATGAKCPKCPVSFASATALADHVKMWHRASGAWELAANQAQHQARAYQQKLGLQV